MTSAARCLLAAALIAALLDRGGAGDLVRPALAAVVAVALLLAALGAHARFRVPACGWIVALFAPAAALCLAQALPIGWHHPWVDADLAALGDGAGTGAWSIEPGATAAALSWTLALGGLALALAVLFRGERARALADAVVLVGAGHALLGLGLALGGIDWPSAANADRARGSFVYTNHAAAFWAACLPLALLQARSRGGWPRWGAAGTLALAVLLSGSRGGIIVAALVCLPLALALLPRRRRWWWAGGVAAAVAAWLAVIGVQDVAQRFDALRGPAGPTLDGRVLIWRAALPVIADAGALGSGAGTVVAAWRRSGDTTFPTVTVNHLHNDPLEWTLEFGWAGAAIGLAGLLAAGWLLRPGRGAVDERDADERARWRGAALGLLILASHSCADFIWHNPAIDLLGVVLLVVLAQGRAAADSVAVRRSGALRLGLLAAAMAIAAALVPAYPFERDAALARHAGDLIAERLRSRLPIDSTGPAQATLAGTPAAAELAVLKAWLLRTLPLADGAGEAERAQRLEAARQALAAAARLAPGSAQAWAERARLAAATGDQAALAVAAQRALAWAPAWPEIQAVVLDCARSGRGAALGEDQQRRIIERLLGLDLEQPAWFFALAAQQLGDDGLARRLATAGPRLRAAALPWLAERGPLADWLALRRELAAAPVTLPPELEALRAPLYGDRACRLVLAVDAPGRRAQAEALAGAGLGIPAELATALRADGEPWSVWAAPPDLLDPATRATIDRLVRGELHQAWAQAWADRLAEARRALDGDWSAIGRDSDPALVAALAGDAPPRAVPANERQRCRLILARYRRAEWQALGAAVRWSWLYVDGAGASAPLVSRGWAGVAIDGRWVGWTRGATDLAPLAGAGLHRIAVLSP